MLCAVRGTMADGSFDESNPRFHTHGSFDEMLGACGFGQGSGFSGPKTQRSRNTSVLEHTRSSNAKPFSTQHLAIDQLENTVFC